MTVAAEVAQEPVRRRGLVGRFARRCVARWRPILLTVLLVASTGFGVGYFHSVYRVDLQTNDPAVNQAIKAASDGAVALLSYSPETLTRDFNNAKSRLTENYLAYYQQFAEAKSRRQPPWSGPPYRKSSQIQQSCLFS